ncbi:response regulator [Pseudooceanicola sp. CBS1P-1]|uniref:histidine kinase n=2 Tax=Paracoccaceae TaxID=31989 RepID=A0A6L7FYB0_9RHOB|nr:response regulator [Pseudooceanicola endophyticus]MXN16280.1 response regulator [Pseudooceanicola albus]
MACSAAFFLLALVVPSVEVSLTFAMSGLVLAGVLLGLRLRGRGAARPLPGAEAALRSLADHDTAAILVADGDGAVRFANAAAGRDLGAEQLRSVDAALSERIHSVGPVIDRLQEAALQAGSAREDVVTLSGHARLSVQSLDDGRFYWRLEDFGPGRSEAELDARLPMVTLGRGGAVLYMNAAARRLAGRRPQQLSELFLGPVRPGHPVEVRTPQGSERRRLVEIPGEGGRRDALLLPLSEEDTLPEGLSQADRTIWDLIDGLPVAILRLSPSGEIELANTAACALLDIPRGPEMKLADLMEGLGRSIPGWLHEVATHEGDAQYRPRSEFLRLSRSEREIFVQVVIKPVRHAGRPALIAVLSDATELKTLEAQFVQTQKMQAIGQLAGGVAHDFNNLLTAISGHCDLLLLRHDAGDPDFADLIQINQNANRAAALVGQLLAFSRKQTLRPETLDLRDTLSDLTHLLNRLVGEKVRLNFTYDPVLPEIRADKRQLEQVLMNLVVNARDAMPTGGEIRITTEVLHLAEAMTCDRALVPAGEYVSVNVTDTGVGIPPDKLSKVFEPFFTTKRVGEGTGLGLSTAYGIVKQSGGFIFVDSTPGVGTCFTLLFPALRDIRVALPETQQAAPRTEANGDGVVLLVEDEAPVRAFASRALRLKGFSVLEAANAEQALETLRGSRLQIDVFVTDVIMPGMDGPSWVRKALVERPDVRVIFVSGYAEDSFSDSAAKIPNSVFLPKPFSLSDLTETVRAQVEAGKAQRSEA